MKIFRVAIEANRCQWVMPTDPNLIRDDRWRFDGTPVSERWGNPEFYIYNPVATKSNFYILKSGVLCFDEAARNNSGIAGFLERAGEILPLKMEGGGFLYALNVTECVNTLNHEETQWRVGPTTGNKVAITKYVFLSERLPESVLFKIPETRRAEILTFSGRLANPDDEFIRPYENSGLTGLVFQEIPDCLSHGA